MFNIVRPFIWAIAFFISTAAIFQGGIFILVPRLDNWKQEIILSLSDNYKLSITADEISAHLGLYGLFLSATNVTIKKQEVNVTANEIYINLNVFKSLFQREISVSKIKLSDGKILIKSATDVSFNTFISMKNEIKKFQNMINSIGHLSLSKMSLQTKTIQLQNLFLDSNSGEGIVAQGIFYSEKFFFDGRVDWRFPQELKPANDFRLNGNVKYGEDAGMAFGGNIIGWFSDESTDFISGHVITDDFNYPQLDAFGSGVFSFQAKSFDQFQISGSNFFINSPSISITNANFSFVKKDNQLDVMLSNLYLDGSKFNSTRIFGVGEHFKGLTKILNQNKPQVELENIYFRKLNKNSPQIKSQVRRFGMNAAGDIPGIAGVSGNFYLNRSQGWFEFSGTEAFVNMPKVFPHPWSKKNIYGKIFFTKDVNRLFVAGRDIVITDHSLKVKGGFFLDLMRDGLDLIQVELSFDGSHEDIPVLLPNVVTGKKKAFIMNVFKKGKVKNGRISFSGPIGKSEYKGLRTISIFLPLQSVEIKTHDKWPDLQAVDGTLEIAENQISLKFSSAKFASLKSSELIIGYSFTKSDELKIDGHLTGDSKNFLGILNKAGLSMFNSKQRINISGPLNAGLSLTIRPEDLTSVDGSIELHSDNLMLAFLKRDLVFKKTSGTAKYVIGKSFSASNIQTSLDGLAVAGDISINKDSNHHEVLSFRGSVKGDGQKALSFLKKKHIVSSQIAENLLASGSFNSDINVFIPTSGASISDGEINVFGDNLRLYWKPHELALNLIEASVLINELFDLKVEKFSGYIEDVMLHGEFTAKDQEFSLKTRSFSSMEKLGSLINYKISESFLDGSAFWDINAQKDSDGLFFNLSTDGKGLASKFLNREGFPIKISYQENSGERKLFATADSLADIEIDFLSEKLAIDLKSREINFLDWNGLDLGYENDFSLRVNADIKYLKLGKNRFKVDKVEVERYSGLYNIKISGSDLDGIIIEENKESFKVALNKIKLSYPPKDSSSELDERVDPLKNFDPGLLPNMAVYISELQRGKIVIREIDFNVSPSLNRIDVRDLTFIRNNQKFSGQFAWDKSNGHAKSAFDIKASGSNLGKLLRLNTARPILEAVGGHFKLSMNWQGSPASFSILKSNGVVEVWLNDGRFLDLGPSSEVLKLFGILNVDNLDRRLKLDFLDLIRPGVSFDKVHAKATLENGLVTLNPELKMEGPSSSFQLTGIADLKTESLNQKLIVDVPLSANLPLASMLLGAPQIGGAIYLVEKMMGKKLIRAGKTTYYIEGTFDDPIITKRKVVPRKNNESTR